MKSHPVSYNCPFTVLFLLPSEPIWLTGQKWGHLRTKPLKLGDDLLTLEFGSHLKHLLLALTHMGAESTTGGPRFTFWLFVLLASSEGCARSTACLPPTRGFPGANAPSLRHRDAAGLQSSYCGLRVASSAPLLHCSSSAPLSSFSALPRFSHTPVRLLPKSQGQGLSLGQQAK